MRRWILCQGWGTGRGAEFPLNWLGRIPADEGAWPAKDGAQEQGPVAKQAPQSLARV